MKTLVLATGNKGKLKEIREMLPEYEILSLKDIGFTGDIVEDGDSYYLNALIKARAVGNMTGFPVIADDSGLSVEALNGAPGIYSARYAGDGVDEHNIDLLLKNMEGVSNRRAKFVCTMVYLEPSGKILSATGETFGEILRERSGDNGFGYDPVFYSYDLKKSMGVASAEEKNSVSHRARAIMKLKELIKG